MTLKKLSTGDTAPAITVKTTDNETLNLDADFWSQGPTILTFLRHFG